MKITHIQAENFQGIVSADVEVAKPVVLFAGNNHAGKSSLQEAVRMALTGEAVRVSLKKEYGALVTDGAKEAYAEVAFDDKRAFITLPSGKSTPLTEYVPPSALPYVLNAQRFAKLPANERRSFLFGLMGLKITPEVVVARLIAKGVDAEKAKAVAPLLRAGFPEACKEAAKKATEAKGAWRAATGETYGSVKATTWAAAKPEVDAALLADTAEEVRAHDEHIAEANQALGGLQSDKRRHDEQKGRISSLNEKAEKLPRLQAKLKTDEAELLTWQEKVAKVEGIHVAEAGMPCPHCQSLLVLAGGQLILAKAASTAADTSERDRLPEYRKARDLLVSAVANARRDIAEAERAVADLKSIAEAEGTAPTSEAIEAALKTVADLRTSRSKKAAELERIKSLSAAAAEADKVTAKAKAHHADVEAWDKITTALAPDGIPGEMLTEALMPINHRLLQTSADTEWAQIEITSDMEIRSATSSAGWRPYSLLSESEQWRADAMLAEAISFQSKLKLLALDRFDVLDMAGREDLLIWLDILAKNGEIDTALIFGTLKALPSTVPPSIQTEWINHGRVGQIKEAA